MAVIKMGKKREAFPHKRTDAEEIAHLRALCSSACQLAERCEEKYERLLEEHDRLKAWLHACYPDRPLIQLPEDTRCAG